MSELNEILFGQVFMQYYAFVNIIRYAYHFVGQSWIDILIS